MVSAAITILAFLLLKFYFGVKRFLSESHIEIFLGDKQSDLEKSDMYCLLRTVAL